MRKFKFFIFLIFIIIFIGSLTTARINQKNIESKEISYDEFYFVQITDTHIRHKIVDRPEATTKRLTTVLHKIKSFENPPAFVVITGDLCEWAGSDPIGALNCQAFLSCFYEDNDQLYTDSNLTIPVYTTPGNHDYVISRNLKNYHAYIDKNHIEDEDRYIITYGNVSLFFMDTGPNYYSNPFILFEWHGVGLYDTDIQWLEEELINCTSPYKIILMHHPAVGEEQDLFIKNREQFVDLCENYEVEIVLAGHTHNAKVYDVNLNKYETFPLNCSKYSTLYVQSDDCKQGIHYRNISFSAEDLWIETNEEIAQTNYEKDEDKAYQNRLCTLINHITILHINSEGAISWKSTFIPSSNIS
jgi:predicted MPP superfamily phosphohydrolase